MANNEEIVFRMNPDGSRELEANGFKGKACEKATAKMVKELGKVQSQKKKKEYNQPVKEQERETNW